jgi:hypothetical protein
MARIIEIENYGRVNNSRLNSKVRARYSEFDFLGERYARIETFGSNDRKVQGMASQNIQFNRIIAIELIRLLRRTFDIND